MENLQINQIPAYQVSDYDREIEKIYASLSTFDRKLRFQQISSYFLGRPYLLGALGEGPNGRFDQNPLYRTDAFDCLTYVNTVLALFFAKDLQTFQEKIIAINYENSKVAYETRHHFMNDWNRSNIQLGLMEDITLKITDDNQKPVAVLSQTLIDKPGWFQQRQLADIKLLHPVDLQAVQQRLQELRDLSQQVNSEMSTMNYLPLSILFDENKQPHLNLFSQIPDTAIIEIVRPNWDLRDKIGTCLDVSHLGFAIWQGNTPLFREASSIHKKIIDIPLIDYLKNYINHSTIKGIYVLQLRG